MNNTLKFTLSQTARILNIENIGRSKTYKILRERGIVDKLNKPCQKYINEGLLDFAEPPVSDGTGIFRPPVTLVVGEKGLNFIKKVVEDYLKDNPVPVIYKRKSTIMEFDGDDTITFRDAFGE